MDLAVVEIEVLASRHQTSKFCDTELEKSGLCGSLFRAVSVVHSDMFRLWRCSSGVSRLKVDGLEFWESWEICGLIGFGIKQMGRQSQN